MVECAKESSRAADWVPVVVEVMTPGRIGSPAGIGPGGSSATQLCSCVTFTSQLTALLLLRLLLCVHPSS